jgi:DNA-binding transcriptional LysR family regulator
MVAAGLGVCMYPEYSITHPGLDYRPLTNPDVERNVELVTVAGRRQSPTLRAFVKACKSADWQDR